MAKKKDDDKKKSGGTLFVGGQVVSGGGGNNNKSSGGGQGGQVTKALGKLAAGKPGKAAKILEDVNVRKALKNFDYNEKDLAKVGLSLEDITEADFLALKQEAKGLYKDDKKLSKGDLKTIGTKLGGYIDAAEEAELTETLDELEEDAEELVPPIIEDEGTPLTGTAAAPARENMYFSGLGKYARQAVRRARGFRAAIGTSARGDPNYGRSVARPTLGAA